MSRLRGCQTAEGEKQHGGAVWLDFLQTAREERKTQVAYDLSGSPHEDPLDPFK